MVGNKTAAIYPAQNTQAIFCLEHALHVALRGRWMVLTCKFKAERIFPSSVSLSVRVGLCDRIKMSVSGIICFFSAEKEVSARE